MSVPDSRTRTHRPATLLLLSLLAAGLVSCAPSDPRLPTQSAEPSYDIAPLLEPDRKYLGVALGGSLQDTEAVTDFTEQGRKEPNLREYYAKWGDPFHSKQNRTVWDSGQLPFLVWEPFSVSPAAIRAVARSVDLAFRLVSGS
ncbi:hypothetical protein [Streptomyces sp. NPDC090029]|uniref:hypothetical protein n=1 Tax=Streptomyces sp. NPDC090029 TaxID=3365924 RepID=UPI00382AB914